MRLRFWLIGVLIVLAPCSLWAVIGTPDVTPAATLLFPYFAVDLDRANGQTTLITIQAATATATLAHVTLWTDLGIPTYSFDVYLTGYDMQAINVRDIFLGNLPLTADDGADPQDWISNQGMFSQDINYPGSVGPCAAPLWDPTIPAENLADIRAAHTGERLPSSGRYAGTYQGDSVARGYITVDIVTQCSDVLPNQMGYFVPGGGGIAYNGNWLLGEYLLVNLENNFMEAEKAVHIEASADLTGFRTFYGRLASAAGGSDNREPLPSSWAFGALTDPFVGGQTSLMAWRDPGVEVQPFVSQPPPVPFPMPLVEARAFDDESRPTALALTFAPYASGMTRVMDQITSKLGWARLNLNVGPGAGDVRQSWVTAVRQWEGRFSTAANGVVLDPDPPRLQLAEITCPEASSIGTGWDANPVIMVPSGSSITLHINYRLRLFDTESRTLCGTLLDGSPSAYRWAADPLESTKCAVVSPGVINTNDLWISHDFQTTGWGYYRVRFSIQGGTSLQTFTQTVYIQPN